MRPTLTLALTRALALALALSLALTLARCDHIINCKTRDLGEALAKIAPEGVDVAFEGVGGRMLQTVLEHLKVWVRGIVR